MTEPPTKPRTKTKKAQPLLNFCKKMVKRSSHQQLTHATFAAHGQMLKVRVIDQKKGRYTLLGYKVL